MTILKKGSTAAKAFMAKIRAAKGKSKPKAKKVGATKKAQYYVVDREAGNVIDIFNTYNTAVKEIMKFEKEDKANKEFVKDFYEIEVRDAKTKKVVNGVKKVMPTKKASSMHKDTKSHNVNIRVVSGLKKLSGVSPHKAKYFIEFIYQSIERTEYFDKLPPDRYKGMTGINYLLRLTDYGTTLIPLREAKTNLPVKK